MPSSRVFGKGLVPIAVTLTLAYAVACSSDDAAAPGDTDGGLDGQSPADDGSTGDGTTDGDTQDADAAPVIPNATGELDTTFATATAGRFVFPSRTSITEGVAVLVQASGKVLAVASVNGEPITVLARYGSDGQLDTSFGKNGVALTYIEGSRFMPKRAVARPDGKMIVIGDGAGASIRLDTSGVLDATFGTQGLGPPGPSAALVLATDGKIIVAGTDIGANRFRVDRLTVDGAPDPSWGSSGIATTAFVDPSFGRAVAIDGAGGILLAGTTGAAGGALKFALARYDATGALDNAFGSGGKVVSDVVVGYDDGANGIVVGSDGKITLAGSSGTNGAFTNIGEARYDSAGVPDTTLGANGVKTVSDTGTSGAIGLAFLANGTTLVTPTNTFPNDSTAQFNGFAVQTDDKVVGVGSIPNAAGGALRDMALWRHLAAGGNDTAFGTNGRATLQLNARSERIYALAAQPDGKVVAAGDSFVARLLANGQLDASFATAGTYTYGSRFTSVAVDGAGNILLADDLGIRRLTAQGALDTAFGTSGRAGAYNGGIGVVTTDASQRILVGATNASSTKPLVVRLLANGQRDTSFGTSMGQSTLALSGRGGTLAITTQADGKILLGGWAGKDVGPVEKQELFVARLDTKGAIDTSFAGGVVRLDASALDYERVDAIAVQPDGRIVVVATVADAFSFDVATVYAPVTQANVVILRFMPDGTPDTSFGTGGKVTNLTGASLETAHAIVLENGGRIVLAGRRIAGGRGEMLVVRLSSNGTLDTSFGTAGVFSATLGSNAGVYAAVKRADGTIMLGGYLDDTPTGRDAVVLRLK